MATDTLGSLVTKLRLECGHSSNAATGVNMRDQLVYLLNRVQEELAQDYDFPGMTVDRNVPIVLSQRYYSYPTDVPFDNIDVAWLIWNTLSSELVYGIGPQQFALFNSNVGFTSWPPSRWMHHSDDNTFELWPVPNQAPAATGTTEAAQVRFRGTRVPPQMVADADLCVLPAGLLVLYAAAEVMARAGDKGTALKVDKAKEYFRRYKVRQSTHKTKPFIVGGGVNYGRGGRIGLDYIPEGYGNGPGSYTGPAPGFGGEFGGDFDT